MKERFGKDANTAFADARRINSAIDQVTIAFCGAAVTIATALR